VTHFIIIPEFLVAAPAKAISDRENVSSFLILKSVALFQALR